VRVDSRSFDSGRCPSLRMTAGGPRPSLRMTAGGLRPSLRMTAGGYGTSLGGTTFTPSPNVAASNSTIFVAGNALGQSAHSVSVC
jgi:hypothetical protein